MEKSNRNRQEVVWSDKEFKIWIKRFKFDLEMNSNKKVSEGQITLNLLRCPSFKRVEKEIKRMCKGELRMLVKFDKKRGLF